MLRNRAVSEVSTQVPVGMICQVDWRLGLLIWSDSLPCHDKLVGRIDKVPARHLNCARELLFQVWASARKLDPTEATNVLDSLRHIGEVRQSLALDNLCVPFFPIEAVRASMEACVPIVSLEAVLVLADRELGAAYPPGHSTTGRSILGIFVRVAQIGKILPVERHFLHLVSAALELAGQKRGSIGH